MVHNQDQGGDTSEEAREQDDETPASKDSLPGEENGAIVSPGRRRYLKLVGATAAATAGAVAGTSGVAAADYDTITVGAGESRRITLGSNDTLENTLIDVTADQADVYIRASGDGWTIRNVGIKGTISIGDGELDDGPSGFKNVMKCDGNGLVENVYFGDGIEYGLSKTALIVDNDHSGHIECRNMHVAEWSANAVYAAGFGRIRGPGKTDGGGGTISFVNCYFRDNNVAHLRLAADGTLVKNCVFHNTNNVPTLPLTHGNLNNVVNSRGIYTGYGDPDQTIRVEDCDFDITGSNTCGGSNDYNSCSASAVVGTDHGTYGPTTTIHLVDSRVSGRMVGDYVKTTNLGSNPDTTPPAEAPPSAEAAAQGLGFGSSEGNENGGSDDGNGDTSSVLSISGGSPSNGVEYTFEVSETVEKSLANGGSISSEDTITGTSVEGLVAGGTDSFTYIGDVTSFEIDGDATVTNDGEQVDPDELVTEQETETETPNETETETETETGTETPTETEEGDESGSDEPTASENVVLINGTHRSDETARYTFEVSGEVTRDHSRTSVEDDGMAWDSIQDHASGGSVVGIVGNGIDAYSFTGELTSIDIRGSATFTIIRS